ncbi:MAG: glycosyltransferase [Limisphaerales bacterium]
MRRKSTEDTVEPRIILLCSNYAWTVYKFRMPLVRAFRKQGYHVHLLTQLDEYVPKIEHEFDGVHSLLIDRSGTNPIRDFLTLFNIVFHLIRLKPSVFLTFTIKPVIYGGLAARVTGVRAIPNITGLGVIFIRDNWQTWLVKKLYRQALSRSARIFFQNKDDRQLFLDDGLVEREITDCLPGSGVDLAYFTHTPKITSTSAKESFRFLLIARMLWDKGVREYVEAARLLLQSNPHAEFCLLGFLDVQNPAAVSSEQMDEWITEGVVNYLGVSDDVRDEILAADCVVLPSYYPEGVPRSLLESAAMARPIITTDSVGCREVVDDGANGFLCKPRDAENLAAKMEQMMKLSAEARFQMGKNGRAKMEQEFDESIVINRYLHEIKEVLNHPKPRDASLSRWLFWATCLLLIFISLAPFNPTLFADSKINFLDKIHHISAYCALCVVGFLAYRKHVFFVVTGLFFMGVMIEAAQYATGWRYMELGDILANAVGITIGFGLFNVLFTKNGELRE